MKTIKTIEKIWYAPLGKDHKLIMTLVNSSIILSIVGFVLGIIG